MILLYPWNMHNVDTGKCLAKYKQNIESSRKDTDAIFKGSTFRHSISSSES